MTMPCTTSMQQDYPLFLGNWRYMRLPWLHKLTASITLDMTNILKRGPINNLAGSLCLCFQPCGGHDVQSYGVSDRGETSQQRQGTRRAEETG
ncbi:hypothetical protein Taro_032594 [Colocasia esculenta]|uniref:Uncharacterized protein n=1 Tax=Colocasia esculenta TaxID=4460 RepID=A0A843VXQ9_COLES|nr:hypothetical protein [Colocasia esculenta]